MKRIPLTPDLSSITELEQSLEEFARVHDLKMELKNCLNLMLDELITNSVNYSLQTVSGPELEVCLSVEEPYVVAQVEDNGPAFDPFTEAPEADTTSPLTDRPIGGLGIYLTKKFADEYAYERIGERNRVTLRCQIAPP